jgi:hypothetical protein
MEFTGGDIGYETKSKTWAFPSLRSGRAIFPPFLLGGLLPSGLGFASGCHGPMPFIET